MAPDHRETPPGTFLLVFRGYFWGMTAFMFPIGALVVVGGLIAAPFAENLPDVGDILVLIAAPLMILMIAAGQALMISVIVIFGLHVRRSPIVCRLVSSLKRNTP